MTVDELLDKSRRVSSPRATRPSPNRPTWPASAACALVAYEAGQHLVGHGGAENDEPLDELFHAANRHPRMKTLYLDYLAGWKQNGGTLIAIFSSLGTYSKWGSWGLMEYHGQPADEAPKVPGRPLVPRPESPLVVNKPPLTTHKEYGFKQERDLAERKLHTVH